MDLIDMRDSREEVHQIHGTGRSFSSKPDDLDETAVQEHREITHKGIRGLEVLADPFEMDPENLPKEFFLSHADSHTYNISNKKNPIWRPQGFRLGYGIGHYTSGYEGFKKTFVYHKGNHATNWIMNVYILIHENLHIKLDDVVLCHVFQSDNYDPKPKRVPSFFDFDQTSLNSRVGELEDLLENPKAFKDFDEFYGNHNKCDRTWKASGRDGKRAKIWEHFTNIKVIGPDGKVMLTLAICHGCNMAYLTGKWDAEKGSLSNNGTKTLTEHNRKCSVQRHIAGNPQ